MLSLLPHGYGAMANREALKISIHPLSDSRPVRARCGNLGSALARRRPERLHVLPCDVRGTW